MPEDPALASADEAAARLHVLLLEVLKQLNKAEEEEPAGEGLEGNEILVLLRKRGFPMLSDVDFDRALGTLVENRMVTVLDTELYAWDRGRMIGRRYALSNSGKNYLLEELQKTGRVG